MKGLDTLVIAVGGKNKRLSEYFKNINFHSTKTLFAVKGQPLLKYIIDMALDTGYNRVFLLASFYENEIRKFINVYYKNQNITLISGKKEGEKGGVAKVLSLISDQLDRPFLYSDGDILFEPHLIKEISKSDDLDKILMRCVVSPDDLASTHSRFFIHNDKLSNIEIRCKGYEKTPNKILNGYCSLGLIAINNKIFTFMPEYKEMNDLDVVANKIFKKNSNLVGYKIYRGGWLSIHNKKDIDRINNEYYSKLFRSLK